MGEYVDSVEAVEIEEPDEISGSLEEQEEEFHTEKIYCANCIHCKLIPEKTKTGDWYVLRIRCAAGKWKKKLGQEKMYKYNTITRRYLDDCDAYEEMGDTREFIRELRKNLPNKDEPLLLVRTEKELVTEG